MATYAKTLAAYLDRVNAWKDLDKSSRESEEVAAEILEQQSDLDTAFGGVFGPNGPLEIGPQGLFDFRPIEVCWLWKGNVSRGYPRMRVEGKLVYAHRYFFERSYGPAPRGTIVMHRCEQQLCVRPNHLILMPRTAPLRLAKVAARQTKETREAMFGPETGGGAE